ncbi:MAG: ATP-dependent sacrificial sulfur transferase LarE [Dehalococcoidia bacterium]
MKTEDKLRHLKESLAEMESVLIAYSGGVDSTFLASVASEVLRQRAMVVFAHSPVYPPHELEDAEALARQLGLRFATIESNGLKDPQFVANSPDRCYYCKRELFEKLRSLAAAEGLDWVADGSNYDDRDDYRPGRKALTELGIRSPLWEVKLTKDEIRRLSKERELPTWDKPASPCLASRIPYGTPVSRDTLGRIAEGEQYLRNLGIHDYRLRHHGNIARIEVDEKGMSLLLKSQIRKDLVQHIKALGYTYVTLDLGGYRSGSLNEEPTGDDEARK